MTNMNRRLCRIAIPMTLSTFVWAIALPSAKAFSPPPSDPAFKDLDPSGKTGDTRPQDVITWDGFGAAEDQEFKVAATLRMTPKQDWKIYGHNLQFSGPAGFTVTAMAPPPARRIVDPISGKDVDVYDGGEFTLHLSGAPRWHGSTFPLTVTYVGCTNVICLFPYTQTLDLSFVPYAGALSDAGSNTTAVAPGAPSTQAGGSTTAAATASDDDDLETRLAHLFNDGSMSFSMLLAIVFLGGLLSNLTPCVAPMIPITLRLLARQGASPYASASAYALGIVFTYSILGLVAALSGGLFGSLLASKAFNVSFAVIMIMLGVTMLGFGDFSKLQMLGNRLGSGKPSLKNTLLMGCGAGLVAAPCTGPILATLLAYTARNNAGVGASTALLGTYSLGFALPYVALGGAAAKASRVRVVPQVQVGIKLLFASVMFGLGLYYLRIPFYSFADTLRGDWPQITKIVLPIGGVLTLLWLALPPLQNRKTSMLLPTSLLGLGLFSASQWATHSSKQGDVQLTVYHQEAQAMAAALTAGKPILIDMWAEWCEACKKMDATTFTDPRVTAALAKEWIVLKLDFTETTALNDELQTKYGVQSLPTLVLLPKDGKIAAKQAITGYVNAATLINTMHQYQQQRAE